MRKIIERKITEEQYIRATKDHDATGIFSIGECMYGIYDEHYYKRDGECYVSFSLGDSCD